MHSFTCTISCPVDTEKNECALLKFQNPIKSIKLFQNKNESEQVALKTTIYMYVFIKEKTIYK